jgi:hypothetical protein
LKVRQAPPFDLSEEPILPEDTDDTLKIPIDSTGLDDGSGEY